MRNPQVWYCPRCEMTAITHEDAERHIEDHHPGEDIEIVPPSAAEHISIEFQHEPTLLDALDTQEKRDAFRESLERTIQKSVDRDWAATPWWKKKWMWWLYQWQEWVKHPWQKFWAARRCKRGDHEPEHFDGGPMECWWCHEPIVVAEA